MTRRVEETPTKLGLFRPLSTGSPGWVPSPWMSYARHLSDVAPATTHAAPSSPPLASPSFSEADDVRSELGM